MTDRALGAPAASGGPIPLVSVVVPVRNEQDSIERLIGEIDMALRALAHELIVVDDGSSDGTRAVLSRARRGQPSLRCLAHAENCGQSAALRSGILAARGRVIVTLDGDGQNDPADIPRLLQLLAEGGERLGMVAGQRRRRQDDPIKRLGSRIANAVRGWLLADRTPDTGCGLKAFRREVFLRLPYFDHMHRFLPALILREGYGLKLIDVNHRPRIAGRSNYGTFDRLWVGIVDLMGVAWLQRRQRRPTRIEEW
ncbi:MAG: glycosyltransferase family 2 protein [Alphaproteobacteria bacterium]|nr:glycosyltransferase family 2 protein [Alphaproteobacteria bacterium]